MQLSAPAQPMKVLIANRGEIARRVMRSCRDWGVPTVAVYADPDSDAPFVKDADEAVHIGPADLARSYLSGEAILKAASTSGATHIHPGYGFLSENAEFAQAVLDAGLGWIGPRPEAIRRMGSKIEARAIAAGAGVPLIPGYNESQDNEALRAAADEIGYPILVKASAGGGGKGIRIAQQPDDFDQALDDARTESMRAFGDDDVIVERFITQPRHVEVQVAGDRNGTAIDLGTRECSVQRRYQKVLEEAPAPNLSPATRAGLRASAVALVKAIGYDTVGTVEFIVDTATQDFYFLEMNTRIQVEHTVTEQVCGLDLIQLQMLLATGADMPIAADYFDTNLSGHAFEARINAEDSWAGHLPQTGTVTMLELPHGDHIRWDAAIEAGAEISPHYDSMIGKLIVHAPSRTQALDRLDNALDALHIEGVTTNVEFHRWLTSRNEVRTAQVTTRFLDSTPLPHRSPGVAASSPWSTGIARRFTPHTSDLAFDSPTRDHRWFETAEGGGHAADIVAPFPGLITELHVSPGDHVVAGQPIVTIEAMKMLHPIAASGEGVVAAVHTTAGTQVAANDPLIDFAIPDTGDKP